MYVGPELSSFMYSYAEISAINCDGSNVSHGMLADRCILRQSKHALHACTRCYAFWSIELWEWLACTAVHCTNRHCCSLHWLRTKLPLHSAPERLLDSASRTPSVPLGCSKKRFGSRQFVTVGAQGPCSQHAAGFCLNFSRPGWGRMLQRQLHLVACRDLSFTMAQQVQVTSITCFASGRELHAFCHLLLRWGAWPRTGLNGTGPGTERRATFELLLRCYAASPTSSAS